MPDSPQDGAQRMSAGAAALLVLATLVAIAALLWVARQEAAPQDVDLAEYTPMVVPPVDDTLEGFGPHPDMRVMGIEKAQSTDVLCSADRVARMDAFVVGHGVGELFVDPAQWNATPSGTRAGIASFFSKCRHEGEPIDVLAGPGGDLLAVYDPEAGLSLRSR